METDAGEVLRVADALTSLENRIANLLNAGRPGTFSADEEVDLKIQTASLKQHIKQLNKYGTIDGSRLPHSDTERMFFSKAIQAASSSFMLRSDVSPRNPQWSSGLTTVRGEISYYLMTLKKHNPSDDTRN